MEKKKVIAAALVLLMALIVVWMCLKTKEVSFSEGFVEENTLNKMRYPEESTQDLLSYTNQKEEEITLSISRNGEVLLENKTTKENKTIDLNDEKAVSLAMREVCANESPDYIYILTEKNNVYESKANESILTFTKVYEGKKDDSVSLIHLNGLDEFSTCYLSEVYLKVNDKVMDFNKKAYEDIITSRDIIVGENGTLRYLYNGNISFTFDNKKTVVLKNDKKENIEFILIGKYENKTYLLDKDGNEYIIEKELYDYFTEKDFNEVLNPSEKHQEFKIAKKDNTYEIIFDKKDKKIVESEENNNIFTEVRTK